MDDTTEKPQAPTSDAAKGAPDASDSAGDLADNAPLSASRDDARVRFSGIVEKPGDASERALQHARLTPVTPNEQRWNAMSRQVWLVSRLTAFFIFFAIFFGLPLGNLWAYLEINNGSFDGWSPLSAYQLDILVFAFIVPLLIGVCGYLLSKQLTMMSAAESIAAAAQQIATPDIAAAENVGVVGAAVQGHVSALNEGIDGALTRLASVEAMIRQHVEAIEIAGDAIEHRATGAVARVADERSRLIDLTENLNSQADDFAAAIADRAKNGVEAIKHADVVTSEAEAEFNERLTHLETVAQQALSSFESLREALRESEKTVRDGADAIDDAAEKTIAATDKATQAASDAATSASQNAAEIVAATEKAGEETKKAADAAAAKAAEETARVADAALQAASEQSGKIADNAAASLKGVADAARTAIDGTVVDAAKATRAADEIAEAVQRTSDAAIKASQDVADASARARKSSEEALEFSETAAARLAERNEALAAARADLEKENLRLETLIGEQRKRADRLADAIASQTERLSKLAETQLREQEAAARAAEAQEAARRQALAEAEQKKAAEEAKNAQQTARAEDAPAQEKTQSVETQQGATPKETPADQMPPQPMQKTHVTVKPAPQLPPQKEAPSPAAKTPVEKPTPAKATPQAPSEPPARLDELARDIAERRNPSASRRKKTAPSLFGRTPPAKKQDASEDRSGARDRKDLSWKEIIDAAEDAAPIDLANDKSKKTPPAPAPSQADDEAARAIKIISSLQDFTYDLETRLYGDPPPALKERFERGDRNVFAGRLLRLNEADVKRRIRNESGRDKGFERQIHGFLQGFERLLEDATTSETADEELEEYLSSPLGRVYLLIGATVGYFA
ncbi:MAG: hypothetical protein AAGA09_06005 [Pseudomonadota bacterium]